MTGFMVGSGGLAGSTTAETTGGSTSSAESSTSSTTVVPDASSGTTAASTGTAIPPDLGPPGPVGCLGKIDFLFVISNGGGMTVEQKLLSEAFPAFYASIKAHFADFDTHILVSDTDDYWNMEDCSLCQTGDCDPLGVPPLCGAQITACDSTMGAGVVFPAGKESSARRCLGEGRRYISLGDPDPLGTFLCAAQVGSDGAGPRPAEAMVEALSPALTGPLGCNEGFLRDDAMLVVTLISDIYDQDSKGWPPSWSDALLNAKHGDGDAVYLMVLTTDIDLPQFMSVCDGLSGYKNPLRELVERVPHSKIGSICLADYGPFFEEGAAEILELCQGFIPQ